MYIFIERAYRELNQRSSRSMVVAPMSSCGTNGFACQSTSSIDNDVAPGSVVTSSSDRTTHCLFLNKNTHYTNKPAGVDKS